MLAPELTGSVVAVHGLSTCGFWALEWAGLVAPQHVGILVVQPGIEPASPALEGGFLTTRPPVKSLFFFFADPHFDGWLTGRMQKGKGMAPPLGNASGLEHGSSEAMGSWVGWFW